ncbi:MAG: helix-turn-helix domain-containing protein [Chromatiaceae bacterium]|nr:helix-turn-helix domain-containing protein [Chromatiaceae bacterium]MCF8002863.1 helix-turn-helix domain-containing protein [Chromatiaceae bacterium]
MDSKKEAAALAGACRDEVIGSAGVRDYCPPARKVRQRDRLLNYLLKVGSITTAEARTILKIMSPASRVLELRQRGWLILERFDKQQGCGRYILASDGEQGGSDA